MIVKLCIRPMWKSLWASSPQVGMGIRGKLCELVAVGPGGSGVIGWLKPDTTGLSHSGRSASNFSTFPLISSIIYIPSLGVKVQSDAHYSSKKIISL